MQNCFVDRTLSFMRRIVDYGWHRTYIDRHHQWTSLSFGGRSKSAMRWLSMSEWWLPLNIPFESNNIMRMAKFAFCSFSSFIFSVRFSLSCHCSQVMYSIQNGSQLCPSSLLLCLHVKSHFIDSQIETIVCISSELCCKSNDNDAFDHRCESEYLHFYWCECVCMCIVQCCSAATVKPHPYWERQK